MKMRQLRILKLQSVKERHHASRNGQRNGQWIVIKHNSKLVVIVRLLLLSRIYPRNISNSLRWIKKAV